MSEAPDSADFVRRIAELLPVVVTVVDLTTGCHSYISRDVVGLHGYSLDEIARMKDPSFELGLPDDLRGSHVRGVALFLSFGSTKGRQTAASDGTKQNSRIGVLPEITHDAAGSSTGPQSSANGACSAC